MSYAPASGSSGTYSIYNQQQQSGLSGYSSSSDLEGPNSNNPRSIVDYSDHEGYSSAASSSFDFAGNGTFRQQRMGTTPPYAQRSRYGTASQSPPAQPQLYTGVNIPSTIQTQQQQQQGNLGGHRSGNSVSPVNQTTPVGSVVGGTGVAATSAANQGGQQQQYQRIARFVGPPPVALACTECRSRHLKCDAGTPQCSRCVVDKRECNYVKSRRGWKGTRRKKVQQQQNAAGENSANHDLPLQSGTDTENPDGGYSSAPPPLGPSAAAALPGSKKLVTSTRPGVLPTGSTFSPITGPQTSPLTTFSPITGTQTSPLTTLRTHNKNSTSFPSQQEPPNDPPATANLIQLYYIYFHASHPFCLPAAHLIKTSAQHLTVLLPVMRYIASFFAKLAPTSAFCREAELALFGSTNPPAKDPFTVQALLLFAIGLHSEGEQARSAQVKDFAAELALELGMNQKEFSEGVGGPGESGRVLEESWRRTWWELYFVDGLMAGVHQRDNFKLWSVECTVPLPCEELDYAGGRIPEPHSLQEFDDRYFAAETTVFSSFAYRVEAVRILGQVLSVSMMGSPDETRADAADASLANWGLHLPEVKKELVKSRERRVDEMLFQAHMVINAAIMYLNRPKSHLAIPLISDETSVTPPTSWNNPTKPMALHTARTIAAANTISKLVTLPTPLIKHTPFLTCIITLACVVHLSACSWLLSGDEGFLAKERIRLGVGALRSLGNIWGVAGEVLMQVKNVARDVFRLEGEGGGAGIVSEEEVLRFIEEEEAGEWGGVGEGDWAQGVAFEWDGL